MLLGTCMRNILLEAVRWQYVEYGDYKYDMQMSDFTYRCFMLLWECLDDNPKHEL